MVIQDHRLLFLSMVTAVPGPLLISKDPDPWAPPDLKRSGQTQFFMLRKDVLFLWRLEEEWGEQAGVFSSDPLLKH